MYAANARLGVVIGGIDVQVPSEARSISDAACGSRSHMFFKK